MKGDALAFLDSCFATNMAAKARAFDFKVGENPNVIVFNTMSLALALKRALLNTPKDAFESGIEILSFESQFLAFFFLVIPTNPDML